MAADQETSAKTKVICDKLGEIELECFEIRKSTSGNFYCLLRILWFQWESGAFRLWNPKIWNPEILRLGESGIPVIM